MNDQITLRAEIHADADAAAQRFVLTGIEQDCPYVSGTEASREWRRELQISLLKWSAQGVSA